MPIYLYVLELEKENDAHGDFKRFLDEFLDVYSLYLKTGIRAVKEEAISKAMQIHLRNPEFTFVF